MEFTNVPAFNGTLTDSTFTNLTTLKQIYNTLLTSRILDISEGFVTPQNFDIRLKNNRETNVIALSGLYFKYAQFTNNATVDGKLTYSNGKFYDKYTNGIRQNPYQEMQTFAITPAIKVYKGLDLEIKIPSDIFYSNYQNQIQSIQIDFGNGQGYVTIPYNQNIAVTYANEGVKIWKYKLNLTNGSSLYNQSRIKIEKSFKTVSYGSNLSYKTLGNDTIYQHKRITATIPHLGKYASVNLTIDLIDGNSQITKPLIVAEGFDLGVVLEPENENGNYDYENFRQFLRLGGDLLKPLIYNTNKQYDIIYVDWDNGVDYLQRNAYALEETIKWVNSIKQGSEPNVVLGQSMGGVITRYALSDMEKRGENHDTRLFISHDAPQQGANVPVSIQFMYRHMTRQYIQSSIALFGGDVILPIFNNGVSGSDYLSLLDAPATKQLITNFSTLGYAINNTVHEGFYSELKNKGLTGSGGYPVNSRNIAISNGSECGNTQDFSAGDHLVNYQYHKGLSFWGDLLSLIYNPLGGALGGLFVDADFFGVGALGLIPGHSKYDVDFQAKSIPYGSGNQIYKGRVSYTKKILWLFNVTINITDVEKNQPNGVLPFDSYGGGFYNVNYFLDTNNLPNGLFIRDKFSFISTASALDIGQNNTNLNDTDYLRSYVGGLPPTGSKSSPFDNFSTEFDKSSSNTHNHRHISFNSRNGDWLAKELDATDVEYTDCSAFCSNTEIIGNDSLCTIGSYSVTSESTSTNWWISEGNSLVTYTTNGNEITLTQSNSGQNGSVTLNVSYGNQTCGTTIISKTLKVGSPSFPNKQMTGESNPFTGDYEQYSVPTASGALNYEWYFDVGGVIGTSINGWEIILDQGGTFVNIKVGNPGLAVLVCKATNNCGGTTKYKYITAHSTSSGGGGEGTDPCPPSLKFSSNPMKSGVSTNKVIIIEDPCLDPAMKNVDTTTTNHTITIFNRYSAMVYSKTQTEKEFNINNLQRGFYIVKYKNTKGKTMTKHLLIN